MPIQNEPTLPSAQQAINRLQTVSDKCGPSHVAYLISPNIILTLADARTFGSNLLGNKRLWRVSWWRKEVSTCLKVLDKSDKQLFTRVKLHKEPNMTYVEYDLLNHHGFINTFSQYGLIDKKMYLRLLREPFDFNLRTPIVDYLRVHTTFADFSSDDIDNVFQGLVHGYPEDAVMSMVEYWRNRKKIPGGLIKARIKETNRYSHSGPMYTYTQEVSNNLAIRHHEQLWSTILKEFYESDFHLSLMKNRAFKRKAEELSSNQL